MNQQTIVFLVAMVMIGLVLESTLRRTEGIAHELKKLLTAIAAFAIVYVVAQAQFRARQDEATIIAILAAILAYVTRPKRSRYIKISERRKTAAEYELRTGKKYNPKKHDIDHVIAFSRGGNSRADNLEVKTRRANRKKGAKSPWWDVWGQ